MLYYESIYAVNTAKMRLHDQRINRYGWSRDNTPQSDQLTIFTLGVQAQQESQANLDYLLKLGQNFDQSYLIFTDRKIQFLGPAYTDIHSVSQALDPEPWRISYEQWGRPHGLSRVKSGNERSAQGAMSFVTTWKRCFSLPKQQGVYDVKSGQRLTNRRVIIQNFWDLGFAAQRGRPLTVASIANVGERCELEEITDRAQHYYYKRVFSEAARKIVTNFTSLNRIAAWPGAW